MRQELEGKRGKAWYDALRQLWAGIRADVLATERQWYTETGKLTVPMVAALAVKYDLPWKSMCEFLEHERIIPTGMYDHLSNNGLTAARALDMGRAWLNGRETV